MFALFV